MSRSTHMSLERGVLFFEDGTEVSNVSEDLIKAAPDLYDALRAMLDVFGYPQSPSPQEEEAIRQAVEACRKVDPESQYAC